MTSPRIAAFVLGLGACLGGSVPVAAQIEVIGAPAAGSAENIEGLTVVGKGAVSARPDRMEIDLVVSSASELTADAIVKYRDAKKRLQDAFQELKLPNVKVEERGLLVDQKGAMPNPYYFDYQQNRRTKTEVQLSRRLVVQCTGIREMEEEALLQLVARLLDVAQDAGGQVGPPQPEYNPYYYRPYITGMNGLVRFVLEDYEALQERAYQEAIADARARAQRLAKLGGMSLGPILGIREVIRPEPRPEGSDAPEPDVKRLESSRLQEIPIRVELVVRFQVLPGPGSAARADGR